ncbi:MAG: glycoside hydrolase family 99-like domain-containing protein [Ferruginibacter sp.]|nr:glycoside hydrolase family 99-like domain-containing protein [Cytophagales bacterium]
MKTMLHLLAMVWLVACQKEDAYLPTNFDYPIPPVAVTENVNVGAYYATYAAADWAKKYTHTPQLGEYSPLSAQVMAQHRAWADLGGVDFFVFNWNGAATGDAVLNAFTGGRNNAVKMVINYNLAHLAATNAAPLTGAKRVTLINEFKRLATTHFNQAYYYTVDGQPVVLISPLNLPANASASVDFNAVIAALRAAMNELGINPYIIGEITSGWLPPQRYRSAVKAVDAVDLNNWATDNYDRSVFFPSFSDMNWQHWTDSTTAWQVDFVPCIFPGYNDKTFNPASSLYDIGRSAAFYTDYCHVAKRNLGEKRIVLINSWNNFQMGTALEPAQEYGTTYLELTRSQFKVN